MRAARLVPTSRSIAFTPLSRDPGKLSDTCIGIVTCFAQTRQSLQGLEQGAKSFAAAIADALGVLRTPFSAPLQVH